MKIKTLSDILKQNSPEKKPEPEENLESDISYSPYFEDDPAYQEYLDNKLQDSLEEKQYSQSPISTRPKKTKTSSKKTVSSRYSVKNEDNSSKEKASYYKKKATKNATKTVYAKSKNDSSRKVVNPSRNYKPNNKQTNKVAPPPTLDIKAILQEVKDEDLSNQSNEEQNQNHSLDKSIDKSIDNLTAKLAQGLKTDEQRQAEINEIKADRRLRWLGFYYLSTREHSAKELKDKLLAKEQDPVKIDALLIEFAENGYQSDMRTAFMVIREGIRKGRGRRRIEQDFYKRKIDVPKNIDELIELANEESAEFVDFVDEEKEVVNWLKLAVEARVKKYGDEIPTDNKDKAKQLRFLQYRGFQSDICFEALRYDLESLAEYSDS